MLSIASRFQTASAPVKVEPMGNGHINVTWLVTCAGGEKYTLQKINNNIFRDVPALMRNITLVTDFLREKDPRENHALRVVPTDGGMPYLEQDGFYRMYGFVEGLCLEKASCPEELGMCGKAFGAFQSTLAGFDASLLSETIPRFHDTPNRLHNLIRAAEEDKLGRLKEVKDEYEFAVSREKEARSMTDDLKKGLLTLRVTHNDTKLNNVILDAATKQPLCVIDLDTIMPGLAANDFGDCIRSGATTGAEDEPDTSKIRLDLSLYEAFARGFIGECKANLTPYEIRTLPMGAYLMAYECGVRFLSDYLEGDTYFRIKYDKHNLVRCRTQFKLVADTEKRMNEINKIIAREANA